MERVEETYQQEKGKNGAGGSPSKETKKAQ
jgi:hypothetical protein